MLAAGMGFLGDDILRVIDGKLAVPSFPLMKLSPDAAGRSGLNARGERLHPESEKLGIRTDESFVSSLTPLSRVYVLERGSNQRLEPIRGAEAVIELIRHTYAASVLHLSGDLGDHFDNVTKLARTVQVKRLVTGRLRDLDRLPNLVESDLAQDP
jgi:hypothetical protein